MDRILLPVILGNASTNNRSLKNVNSNKNNTNVNKLNIIGINPNNITNKRPLQIKTYVLRDKHGKLYDCYDSFVINAHSELEARRIAQFSGGDETRGTGKKKRFWTNTKSSSCKLLNNKLSIVCSSFNAS